MPSLHVWAEQLRSTYTASAQGQWWGEYLLLSSSQKEDIVQAFFKISNGTPCCQAMNGCGIKASDSTALIYEG